MRQFDNRTSWLDNEGKPLAGRVKFCKFHTTELENIYNVNGNVPLDNPMFTNTLGQLNNQVFLSDNTNYTVRFEKYVGNGDMTEDEDNWLFQYSCDNLWDIYGINVDATTFQLVNNIADLRALDPNTITTRDNSKVVILGGYNTIGDKPQVMYVWNASSIESDNGGSVIKVATISTGRWELVNTFGANGIDVRHFGVFGADSISDTTDVMSLQIGYANTYAQSVGLPLYFPANDGLTWYKINGINLYGSIFAQETKVFGNTGTSSTITVTDDTSNLDVYTNASYKAVFTITGPVVKTSWGKNSTNCVFNPTYKLIVDSVINTSNKSFSNIVIDCQYELVEDVSLTNCQINAVKKLGDNSTFIGCKLTESMFTDACDYNTITVYDNDIIDIDDWPTTSKWLTLVTQNTAKPLDFKGRTVDNTCYVGWSICQYRNAVFDNFDIVQDKVAFIGCNGTVNITRGAVSFIHLDNSNITFNVQSSTLSISDYLYSANSSFTFGKNINMKTLTVGKSTITDAGHIYTVSETASLDNSTIQVQINAPTVAASKCDLSNVSATYPMIVDCIIRGTIYQYSHTGADINFILQGNTFYEGGKHSISAGTAGTKVVGSWIDNTSLCSYHFIEIDRSFIDSDEQVHTYTYEGNKGPNVLQKLEANWSDIQIIAGTAGSPKVIAFHQVGGETNFPVRADFYGQQFHVYGGTTNPDVYLTQFSMFSVGTRNIGQLGLKAIIPQHLEGNFYNSPTLLSVCAFTASVDEKERLWYTDNVGVPAGIVFVSGYTWRITSVSDMYEISNALALPQSYFEIPVNYHISRY